MEKPKISVSTKCGIGNAQRCRYHKMGLAGGCDGGMFLEGAPQSIYLITAYPKNEKSNLSKAERNEIAKMIVRLEHGLKEQEGKNECIQKYHAGLE